MKLRPDEDLTPLNTLRLPARARWFAEVPGLEDLREALEEARRRKLAVRVLGGGSNVILSGVVDGLVLRLVTRGIEVVEEEGETVRIRVAAGEDWPGLVERCMQEGWHGLENLALIPGTAGAAPVQNIGAYGVELSDVLQSLEVLDPDSGDTRVMDLDDCGFSYRHSLFKEKSGSSLIITSITLKLTREPKTCFAHQGLAAELTAMGVSLPTPQDVYQAVCKLRRQKLPDPAVLPNAGSFFKNPYVTSGKHSELESEYPDLPAWTEGHDQVKLAAGWLIERCGLKGKRFGPVGVHDRQALVLVNHGGASASDFLDAAQQIQQAVRERFGLELKLEPRVWD